MRTPPFRRGVVLGAGALIGAAIPVIITSAGSAVPLPETCTTTTYDGFGSVPAGELMVNGNASIVSTGDGQVLRVTPANFNQAGSAFTTNKVTLLNDGSFSTAYSFRFTNQIASGADGLVFTVRLASASSSTTGSTGSPS